MHQNAVLCGFQYCKGSSVIALWSVNAFNLEKNKFNPLPDDKILDLPKLKQIADNILKCI